MSLTASELRVGYDGRVVLDGLSFSVEAGETVGLCGPSGSGKSTLARALAGLVRPAAGSVMCDGVPVSTRRGRMSGAVAMLFQSPRRSCSPRVRLGDLIAEPLRLRGVPGREQGALVAAAASEAGLGESLLGRLPAEVSDGQLQRAALARALAAEPHYLICDEATTMLDALTTASVVAVLKRRAAAGLGVLAISHDRELLDVWADRVVTLGA
ncbi:MAG TPA: ATP-binding cassette domain-containing protein [Propionibacterium sp.]|nr:ATP-binding cassette domain-containing protein [Propionibacterium sp.]